jgi:hypothetical protein
MRSKVLFGLLVLCTLNVAAQRNIQSKHLAKSESSRYDVVKTPRINGSEYVLRISTQAEFDKIDVKLRSLAGKYRNVLVKINPGVFYYKNKHLYLGGINNSELSLRIEGDRTTLIAKGNDYTRRSNRYNGDLTFGHCFLTDQLDYLDLKGDYSQVLTPIEIVNEKSKLCRLKVSLPDIDASGAYIQLNAWYMIKSYPITKIKGGYLYFTATDLTYINSNKCYNVNYDYGISKILPRYVIKNLKGANSAYVQKGKLVFPQQVSSVHECIASQFLMLHSDRLKYFHIKGIEFVGNNSADQLFSIRNVKADKILISNCTFRYIKSPILRCIDTDNLVFSDNIVQDCFGNAVWSYNNSANTVITNNVFSRTIHHVDRSSCVLCFGKNFYVANNVFMNFGGMAIFAGVKYNQPKTAPNSGIIENNEIFYTSDYLDFMRKYSLIDGGAIYLSTHTDGIIVRYNYIHGFGGIDSKRSIYCDDGCYDTKIYGNVIVQPDDEQAVFEWYSSGAAAKTSKSNSGIDFMYNVIWGKYKMEERPKSDCVHGTNVIIYTGERPQNVLKNFAAQEKDVFVSEPMQINSLKELSPGTMKAIMSLPTYQGMKKWFE